jgi:uncharacterized protein involved in exopolysaccharide biosynthesis
MAKPLSDDESGESIEPSHLPRTAQVGTYVIAIPTLAEQPSPDLFAYLRVVRSYSWSIAAITAVCTAVAIALAFLLKPVYRAEVLLAPATEEQDESSRLASMVGSLGGLASIAGINVDTSSATHEAVATLGSYALTSAFIEDNNLLPILFADKWDAAKSAWESSDPKDVPTIWDGVKLFNEDIRVITEDSETGLITMSIEWTDRDQAVAWANELVRRTNDLTRRRAMEDADRSLTYLREELTRTSLVEMQQVLFQLVESQTNKRMLANVREQYAFKVIDPAVVPDEDDFVSPKRVILIAGGVLAGLFFGVLWAFLRSAALERAAAEERNLGAHAMLAHRRSAGGAGRVQA